MISDRQAIRLDRNTEFAIVSWTEDRGRGASSTTHSCPSTARPPRVSAKTSPNSAPTCSSPAAPKVLTARGLRCSNSLTVDDREAIDVRAGTVVAAAGSVCTETRAIRRIGTGWRRLSEVDTERNPAWWLATLAGIGFELAILSAHDAGESPADSARGYLAEGTGSAQHAGACVAAASVLAPSARSSLLRASSRVGFSHADRARRAAGAGSR